MDSRMEKPSRPKLHRLWFWSNCFGCLLLFIFGKELLYKPKLHDYIGSIVGLCVVIICYFLGKKHRKYREDYANYEAKIVSNQPKYEIPINSKVNENIEKYLEEQRIKKINAKWWQFWI
jgi:hypothetical protein